MRNELAHILFNRYVLFSCEGTAEAVVINKLVDAELLAIPSELIVKDPLTFKPFTRLRKARDIEQRFLTQDYAVDGIDGLTVARVVDSNTPTFKLSRPYRDCIISRAFVTSPEIEMLVIHNEKKYEDWLSAARKHKGLKPSSYCKQELNMPNIKQQDFLVAYWDNPDKLVSAIKTYASKHQRQKDVIPSL